MRRRPKLPAKIRTAIRSRRFKEFAMHLAKELVPFIIKKGIEIFFK